SNNASGYLSVADPMTFIFESDIVDREKREKREKECRHMLRRCHIEDICLCSHIKLLYNIDERCLVLEGILRTVDEKHTSYSNWSNKNLKLLLKQRNIALPKKCTKLALAKRLKQSDSQHPFRLMDLPVEIRLRIYSMAIGDRQDLTISDYRNVAEPALLQTNRQIRSEATPVFYGSKSFRFELQMPTDATYHTSLHLFKAPELAWLQLIGPDRIKDLRHVSFYNRDYSIRIDLTSRSYSTWSISSTEKSMKCPFKGGKEWTLLQMRNHFSINKRLEALDPTINPVDTCSMTVTKAIKSFHALCSESNKLETTLTGLSALAEAADTILEARFGSSRLVDLYGSSIRPRWEAFI
ncbi:hypothetical protein KCU68_g3481, partial [Aureobasidium melanogenum]